MCEINIKTNNNKVMLQIWQASQNRGIQVQVMHIARKRFTFQTLAKLASDIGVHLSTADPSAHHSASPRPSRHQGVCLSVCLHLPDHLSTKESVCLLVKMLDHLLTGMEKSLVVILLLAGLCEDASCHNRTYIPVKTLKRWAEARSYCREKHTDLVTVHSLEEQQQILNVAKDYQFWIGLYRDSDNWQWSTGDAVSYTKWVAGSDWLFCATANAAGSWEKSYCRDLKPFMCYNETSNISERYTLISTLKTWPDAQQYCRQHHTDLVSINSAIENEDIKKKAPASPFWIGLFNNPWTWADGGNSTFQNWNIGQPNGGSEKCVLMYSPNQGKWEDLACGYWKYFVCYKGLCENASCPNRTYIPVRDIKSWTDARSYCREKYTDLVTVRSLEEQQQILNVAKDYEFWIGLYRDSDNWQWSTGDAVSYTKWVAGIDTLFCATADATGSWDKSSCRDQKPFMCYTETSNITERYTLISTLKTWSDAQQYCRQYHTDLVSIKSASENEDIKKKAPASPFWIGLFNNPWKWADEENSTFQNWNIFEPAGGYAKCVLMYSPNQGKWDDWPCDDWKYFVCYDDSNSTTTAPETTEQSTETTEQSTETTEQSIETTERPTETTERSTETTELSSETTERPTETTERSTETTERPTETTERPTETQTSPGPESSPAAKAPGTTKPSTGTQTSPEPGKRRQVVRIEINAAEGLDPEDPKIRDAILAQLQERLPKGMTLRWRKKDGKIFHKQEEEEEEEETETCSKP
ncbi:macrophage mannose receptor 1-like isoform X2 [Acipenser ruthenus]|uniref:macrophage mannose receptor 1-like isoform X2 n=1 Tax=Acipenser ruthenus TaxID=7906 RepID=UPI002740EA68|nr:macrophage mannose receptor 1-like isoform X2 [Acipenser ruthenus]